MNRVGQLLKIFNINLFSRPKTSIFIDISSEEQITDYSCGHAVMANIFKSLGINISQSALITQVNTEIEAIRPLNDTQTIEEIGTPPTIIEKIFKKYGVQIEVKKSDRVLNKKNTKSAEKFLDQKLSEGKVIVTPIQAVPDPGDSQNIYEDGHYVIVCGSFILDGVKNFVIVDPIYHHYQKTNHPDALYLLHYGYDITKEFPKTHNDLVQEPQKAFIKKYFDDELLMFGISKENYGVRFVHAESFLRNWRDIDGFGKPYNHYGIAVPIITG